MAIPSVIRILPGGQSVGTPAEGPTAGRSLIEIYGDGFRLPPTPATTGPSGASTEGLVQADEPQTVSVTLGGVDALSVKVIRSNLLRVITPISPLPADAPDYGEGAVDVVITNLDDTGAPIAGETITVAGGWTYRRPKLDATSESELVRFVRAHIREWKRQVIPEVIFTSHTDWDRDVATAYVEIAQMPAIVLNLRELPENRFYSENEGPDVYVTDKRVEQHRRARTVDLNFDVIGISDNSMEMLNMLALATEFIERNPEVLFDRDPNDASAGQVSYEFDYQQGGDFSIGTRPSESNIHYFTGSIVIRGFSFRGFAGFSGDTLLALTRTLKDSPSLDAEATAG